MRKHNKRINYFAGGGSEDISTETPMKKFDFMQESKDAFNNAGVGEWLGAAGSVLGDISSSIAGGGRLFLKDTSYMDNSIDLANLSFNAGSFDALLSLFRTNDIERLQSNDVMDHGKAALATGEKAINYAKAGAQIGGPWGAVVGAVAGLAHGAGDWIANSVNAENIKNMKNARASMAETNAISLYNTAASNIAKNQNTTLLLNYAAEGGPLNTHGTIFDNGLTFFNTGGTHELNPNLGIPLGHDLNGTPNLVEEGEVKWNDYIFSNRLKADKRDLQASNLPVKYKGKTYAEIAEKLGEESKERPNDPISKRGLEDSMARLQNALETMKQRKLKEQIVNLAKLHPEIIEAALQLAAQNGAAELQMEQLQMLQDPNMLLLIDPLLLAMMLQLSGMPGIEGYAFGGNLFAGGGNTDDLQNVDNSKKYGIRTTPFTKDMPVEMGEGYFYFDGDGSPLYKMNADDKDLDNALMAIFYNKDVDALRYVMEMYPKVDIFTLLDQAGWIPGIQVLPDGSEKLITNKVNNGLSVPTLRDDYLDFYNRAIDLSRVPEFAARYIKNSALQYIRKHDSYGRLVSFADINTIDPELADSYVSFEELSEKEKNYVLNDINLYGDDTKTGFYQAGQRYSIFVKRAEEGDIDSINELVRYEEDPNGKYHTMLKLIEDGTFVPRSERYNKIFDNLEIPEEDRKILIDYMNNYYEDNKIKNYEYESSSGLGEITLNKEYNLEQVSKIYDKYKEVKNKADSGDIDALSEMFFDYKNKKYSKKLDEVSDNLQSKDPKKFYERELLRETDNIKEIYDFQRGLMQLFLPLNFDNLSPEQLKKYLDEYDLRILYLNEKELLAINKEKESYEKIIKNSKYLHKKVKEVEELLDEPTNTLFRRERIPEGKRALLEILNRPSIKDMYNYDVDLSMQRAYLQSIEAAELGNQEVKNLRRRLQELKRKEKSQNDYTTADALLNYNGPAFGNDTSADTLMLLDINSLLQLTNNNTIQNAQRLLNNLNLRYADYIRREQQLAEEQELAEDRVRRLEPILINRDYLPLANSKRNFDRKNPYKDPFKNFLDDAIKDALNRDYGLSVEDLEVLEDMLRRQLLILIDPKYQIKLNSTYDPYEYAVANEFNKIVDNILSTTKVNPINTLTSNKNKTNTTIVPSTVNTSTTTPVSTTVNNSTVDTNNSISNAIQYAIENSLNNNSVELLNDNTVTTNSTKAKDKTTTTTNTDATTTTNKSNDKTDTKEKVYKESDGRVYYGADPYGILSHPTEGYVSKYAQKEGEPRRYDRSYTRRLPMSAYEKGGEYYAALLFARTKMTLEWVDKYINEPMDYNYTVLQVIDGLSDGYEGYLHRHFTPETMGMTTPDPTEPAVEKPVEDPVATVTPEEPEFIEEYVPGEFNPVKNNFLLYVPSLMDTLGAAYMLSQKPDYSLYKGAEKAANNIRDTYAGYIGNRVAPNPMDINYTTNKMINNNLGMNNLISNTSGGNRGLAHASMLANNYNTLLGIGEMMRQAALYNADDRFRAADFNRATDQFNAQLTLAASLANSGLDVQRANSLYNIANSKQAVRNAYDAALSGSLSSMAKSIGNLGKDKYTNDVINWLGDLGYFGSFLGTTRRVRNPKYKELTTTNNNFMSNTETHLSLFNPFSTYGTRALRAAAAGVSPIFPLIDLGHTSPIDRAKLRESEYRYGGKVRHKHRKK